MSFVPPWLRKNRTPTALLGLPVRGLRLTWRSTFGWPVAVVDGVLVGVALLLADPLSLLPPLRMIRISATATTTAPASRIAPPRRDLRSTSARRAVRACSA